MDDTESTSLLFWLHSFGRCGISVAFGGEKKGKMKWAWHVARTEDKKNMCIGLWRQIVKERIRYEYLGLDGVGDIIKNVS